MGKSKRAEHVSNQGVSFTLGATTDGARNALACRGQHLALPAGAPQSLYLLAAATEDVVAPFRGGAPTTKLPVQSWTGFIGQWDDRVWDREFAKVDHQTEGHVVGFHTGYIKRADLAWFATHRHHPERGNEPYRFSYLYRLRLAVPRGARTVQLPDDPRVKILAATAAWDGDRFVRPAQALYDDFSRREPVSLRHVYPPPPRPVYEGVTPVGSYTMDKAASLAALKMGPPSRDDYADVSQGHGIAFRYHDGGGDHQPHSRSGAKDGTLPRLNDGDVAQHDDDTGRTVWWDSEGRFSVDLGAARRIARVNTYSWHVNERATQWFSLWGSAGETMPNPDFTQGQAAGWTLLAVVDTRALGAGGIHGSSVSFDMPVRHLLWVAQDVGNGTFFTEVDIHVAK